MAVPVPSPRLTLADEVDHAAGNGRGRVNPVHRPGGERFQPVADERVMRAAQYNRIGARLTHRDKAGGNLGPQGFIWHMASTQDGFGLHGKVFCPHKCHLTGIGMVGDEAMGIVPLDRARGGEHRDQLALRVRAGGFDSGHCADKGHGKGRPQMRQDKGGGRIAGDDHALRMMGADELAQNRHDTCDQRLFGKGTIGKGGCVGTIEKIGIRAHLADFPLYGKTA